MGGRGGRDGKLGVGRVSGQELVATVSRSVVASRLLQGSNSLQSHFLGCVGMFISD